MDLNFELKKIISNIDINNKPNLFLHSCCGPCSTVVLKRLVNYFNIYIVFYNSNIDTKEEYDRRLLQLKNFIDMNKYNIKIIYYDYNHNEFLEKAYIYKSEKEGGKRCEICFRLRIKKSYDIAREYIKNNNLTNDKNYLCSTLSVSPHKNSILINNIGNEICNDTDLEFLPNDFKKENGYLESVKLSKEFNLYRQDYCGCEFAKNI